MIDSPHGTRYTYDSGCRCVPCRAASAHRRQQARIDRRRGPRLVDAGPARAHCFYLRAMNMGYREIANAADVSPQTVKALCAGREILQADVASRLLAVQPKPALGALVNAKDTWRRIRLLRKDLYTTADIAQRMGRSRLRVGRWFCRLSTALRLRRMYRESQPEPDQE